MTRLVNYMICKMIHFHSVRVETSSGFCVVFLDHHASLLEQGHSQRQFRCLVILAMLGLKTNWNNFDDKSDQAYLQYFQRCNSINPMNY